VAEAYDVPDLNEADHERRRLIRLGCANVRVLVSVPELPGRPSCRNPEGAMTR
jgi:hypothetical protein